MQSRYTPTTTLEKLNEAEMLASGAAADHIRELREDVERWEMRKFSSSMIQILIGFIVGGLSVGLFMAGAGFGGLPI